MSKVNKDPLSYIITDERIEMPKFLTEIFHWEREKVNDLRWKNSSGIYVFFDKECNVAYVGKTGPFGDVIRYSRRPRKKRTDESRIKKHFNGKGKNLMWDYYYKVRLYEFTNFSSRDIYEMWWIEQLKPYGNKAGRYYPFVKPSFDLNKKNWSDTQRNAFLKKVPPEDIILWNHWKSTTGQVTSIKKWIATYKMNFISSLAKEAGTSTIDLYRKIRKKARS